MHDQRAAPPAVRAVQSDFPESVAAPICVPAVAILGHGLGGVHLLLGYAILGLIIATRPEPVQDRG